MIIWQPAQGVPHVLPFVGFTPVIQLMDGWTIKEGRGYSSVPVQEQFRCGPKSITGHLLDEMDHLGEFH